MTVKYDASTFYLLSILQLFRALSHALQNIQAILYRESVHRHQSSLDSQKKKFKIKKMQREFRINPFVVFLKSKDKWLIFFVVFFIN